MRALILNSGMGKRMGSLTNEQPKCMTIIGEGETIISRQLKQLFKLGITKVVITTGFFDKVLIDYCHSLDLDMEYKFINNPIYDSTNYIYSIYLAREYLQDDVVMMHGDLVFDSKVIEDMINIKMSSMAISTDLELPLKDFKAVINEGKITRIGIEFFENAVAAQPLYKLNEEDWTIWLDQIIRYCESDSVTCYAENAFNDVSRECIISPYDFKDALCSEIDTPTDLVSVVRALSVANDID